MRSEEALRQADQRKDEFLATLAHELRNPLAPLVTGLHLLKLGSVPHDSVVQVMERQVNHLVRLVDDLLEVSRITRGQIERAPRAARRVGVVLPARRDEPAGASQSARPRARR